MSSRDKGTTLRYRCKICHSTGKLYPGAGNILWVDLHEQEVHHQELSRRSLMLNYKLLKGVATQQSSDGPSPTKSNKLMQVVANESG